MFRLLVAGVIRGVDDMAAVLFSTSGVDNRIEVESVSSLGDNNRGIMLTWGESYNAAADSVSRPSGEGRAGTSCNPSLVSHSRCCCRGWGECPGVESCPSSSGDEVSAKGSDMLTKVTKSLSQICT